MTHSATITIKFSDYWLSSTGGSGKGDLDMVCYRDGDGCPALPMTQVKGMLRETAELLCTDEVIGLFGERAVKNSPTPPAEGSLRFSGDASMAKGDRAWFAKKENKDKRAALFSRLRSTKINEHGVADTNSLRTAEVAVPLELKGRIDWLGDGDPPKALIDQLCQLTFTFGHGKNDGLGRAIATCSEFVAEANSGTTLIPSGNRLVIDLEPEDPAVFSRQNANEGQQLSHAAPTGASLWGWAIGQLKDDPKALKALLSGEINFSDAAPLIDKDTPTFMRPAVLFAPKQANEDYERPIVKKWNEETKETDTTYQPSALRIGMANYLAEPKYTESRQAQGFGPHHMSLALGCLAPIGKGHRLRSGHEQGAGKAKAGSLFGYQHIAPQITGYRAVIDAPGVDSKIWEKIAAAFQHRLFLGKARNNGYGGGYFVAPAPDAPLVPEINRKIAGGTTVARIWCVSDLALYDEWGTLRVEPIATNFGLSPDWKLCRTETSVTTRRYAPWDSAIRGHESEITVIEAGSVFAFTRKNASNEVITLAERIGDFGERGCGWIAVLPDTMPVTARVVATANSGSNEPNDPELTKWATDREAKRNTLAKDVWINKVTAELNDKAIFGDAFAAKGPSKTQWDMVTFDGSEEALKSQHGWDVRVKDATLKVWLMSHSEAFLKLSRDQRSEAKKRLIDNAKRKAQHGGRDGE